MGPVCSLLLHVGPPRTATTTLQKHFFPTIENYLCLQKRAFIPHADAIQDQGIQVVHGERNLISFSAIKSNLEVLQNTDILSASDRNLLFVIINTVGTCLSRKRLQARRRWYELLIKALSLAAHRVSSASCYTGIMIASESLSNTLLGIKGELSSISNKMVLPTQVICSAWKRSGLGQTPCISFCLRDPEEYILSRYVRYSINMISLGEGQKALGPEEWLTVQLQAHSQEQWTSALFPAFHKTFVRYHAKCGFVRPYGFRELLASDDVFDLIGLSGEKSVAFSAFPKENSFPTLMEIADDAKLRLHRLLSDMKLLSVLHQEQLYE